MSDRFRDRFRRPPESPQVEPPYPEPEVVDPNDDFALPDIEPETPTT